MVRDEIKALREALKDAATKGVTPKDIAAAGGVPSFSTVYRFMKGDGAAVDTVLAIEAGWLKIKKERGL